jgi:hypothetical protein
MSDKIKTELCIRDFYAMLGEAMKQCGGGKVDTWKKQSIEEFAEVFAQNGLRIVYMPDRHMNAVKIVWEDPKNNNTSPNTIKIPDLPPRKRQLLCDQFGEPLGEADERPTGYGGFY